MSRLIFLTLMALIVASCTKQIRIEDVKVGKGKVALRDSHLLVHYVAWLEDGKKFDSSYERGKPFLFQLGKGQVIKGLDVGVSGMLEGGIRKIEIPPHLAYGSRGAGSRIPPNATLVFEVSLLKVLSSEQAAVAKQRLKGSEKKSSSNKKRGK